MVAHLEAGIMWSFVTNHRLAVGAVVIALACSAGSDGPIESSDEAIIGACGGATAAVTFTTSGTGSNPLTASSTIMIPSTVTLASTDRFIPISSGGNVQVTLTL
ncbi:MAG TPA: hypothetical protein VH054_16305, partial [Polyangiaceae bacterium]|nr:hypothetical protein [Polyangiaceae bacterium]